MLFSWESRPFAGFVEHIKSCHESALHFSLPSPGRESMCNQLKNCWNIPVPLAFLSLMLKIKIGECSSDLSLFIYSSKYIKFHICGSFMLGYSLCCSICTRYAYTSFHQHRGVETELNHPAHNRLATTAIAKTSEITCKETCKGQFAFGGRDWKQKDKTCWCLRAWDRGRHWGVTVGK